MRLIQELIPATGLALLAVYCAFGLLFTGGGRELGGDVVVAARRGEDPARLPANRPGNGLVGGRIAGVQRQDHVRAIHSGLGDAARDEAHLVGPAEALGQVAVARLVVLSRVHPGQADVEAAPGQVPVRGEREVGVAAAEVDDVQRLRQVVGAQRRVQRTEERVHLVQQVCRAQ